MRYLALVVVVAACGGVPRASTRPTVPSGTVTPADDLAGARSAASHAATIVTPGSRQEIPVWSISTSSGSPHARVPGLRLRLTSSFASSADLFKQANGRQGRPPAGCDRDPIASSSPSSRVAVRAGLAVQHRRRHDAQGDLTATVTTLEGSGRELPRRPPSIDGHLLHRPRWRPDHQLDRRPRRRWTLCWRVPTSRSPIGSRRSRVAATALEQHQYDGADTALERDRHAWRKAPRIDDPYYIAMAYYYPRRS